MPMSAVNKPNAWSWWFLTLTLTLLAIGSTSEGERFPTLLNVGKVAGAFIVLIGAWMFVMHARFVGPELVLLGSFCFWAVGAGLFLYVDENTFYYSAWRLTKCLMVAFSVGLYSARWQSLNVAFTALLVAALILGGYAVLGGDFATTPEVDLQSGVVRGTRALGIVHNPNTVGMMAVWGWGAALLLWGRWGKWGRITLVPTMVLLLAAIVASASRTALASLVMLVAAWLWFNYRALVLRNFAVLVGVLVTTAAGYVVLKMVLSQTFLGHRLERAANLEYQDSSTQERLILQSEAIKIALARPVTGVGLLQYQFYSPSGLGAHAEYADIMACTGVIGVVLYFSGYCIVAARLARMRRLIENAMVRHALGTCLALMVMYAFSMIGNISFNNVTHWIGMASIWGYSYGLTRIRVSVRGALRPRTRHPVVSRRTVGPRSGESPRYGDRLTYT